MANVYGPKLVRDGLVSCLDKYNDRSYLGEPVANIIAIGSGNTMATWASTSHSSTELVTINTPTGTKAHKLTLDINGSNGYYGTPNPSRLTSSGWTSNSSLSYYYSIWIHTNDFATLDGSVYKYVTGQNGWPGISATSITKVVDGITWKLYKGYIPASSNNSSGVEYYTFFKNGTFTQDCVFYVTGPVVHNNGDRHIRFVSGTRSATDGWQDVSVNGNHANLTQLSYSSTKVPGTYSNDFVFDGVDDKVLSDNHSIISDVRGNFSVGMWLKFGGTSTSHHIPFWISDSNGNGFVYVELGSNYGYLGAATETKARNGYVSGANINDNNWHYIVVTRTTGASVVIYKDGASQTVTTHDMYGGWNTGSGGDLSIGVGMDSGNVYGSSYYTGDSSLVVVYNRVLTDTEVLQNFNAHKGRYGL